MRYLPALMLAILLSAPALAAEACEMEGPHNCMEINDDALAQVTKNTIAKMELTRNPHPFRTQNDEILERAASQTANLNTPSAPSHPDWAFWRQ